MRLGHSVAEWTVGLWVVVGVLAALSQVRTAAPPQRPSPAEKQVTPAAKPRQSRPAIAC